MLLNHIFNFQISFLKFNLFLGYFLAQKFNILIQLFVYFVQLSILFLLSLKFLTNFIILDLLF